MKPLAEGVWESNVNAELAASWLPVLQHDERCKVLFGITSSVKCDAIDIFSDAGFSSGGVLVPSATLVSNQYSPQRGSGPIVKFTILGLLLPTLQDC